MRIKQVSVTSLFGVFHHEISLNSDDKITIIHGPNGAGKTVLLSMINDLFLGKFSLFRRIPFNKFRVDLDNQISITIQKDETGDTNKLDLTLDEKGKEQIISLLGKRKRPDFPISVIEEIVPELSRVGSREWRNISTGQVLSLDDVMETYEGILPFESSHEQSVVKKIKLLATTLFIKTNRLQTEHHRLEEEFRYRTSRRKEFSVPAVQKHSQELSTKIQQTLTKSAELSSSLDRTFPNRVVKIIGKNTDNRLSESRLREELASLEEKRTRLKTAGLLDKDEERVQLPDEAVADSTRDVLSVYVQDVKDKLEVFDDDLEKIELFMAILNKRFKYKKLTISKKNGFAFTAFNGTDLELSSLSSGEQHEIVLLYELLFRVKEDSLILLDEPELSLHIGWQQEFLEDIQSITKLTGFDVLIATHSPDIIHDRWDLTVELKGPDIQ